MDECSAAPIVERRPWLRPKSAPWPTLGFQVVLIGRDPRRHQFVHFDAVLYQGVSLGHEAWPDPSADAAARGSIRMVLGEYRAAMVLSANSDAPDDCQPGHK